MDAEIAELAAAGLTALAVASLFAGVASVVRWRAIDQHLRAHIPAEPFPLVPRGDRTREDEPDQRVGAELTAGLNLRLTRSSYGAMLQARLVRAGLALKASEFILIQAGTGLVVLLVGFLLLRQPDAGVRVLVSLALGLVGFFVPLVFLGMRERRRMNKFEQQLPQAIDSMAGTLQAGATLPQAMEVIAREMLPPISVEFRRVLLEMELGLSFTDSLANLHSRVRSTDLVLLTSAITIQARVGGDLAGIFRTISHTIRERLRIRSEINILTAQGRYSAYIITALPILLFCFLWFTNFAYLSTLFEPGPGRLLLMGGIVGLVAGFYMMKRIIAIEV